MDKWERGFVPRYQTHPNAWLATPLILLSLALSFSKSFVLCILTKCLHKLKGMQSLDEQNWFAYNLFVKRSGRGWNDFNFRAKLLVCLFCQAISSNDWARMLNAKYQGSQADGDGRALLLPWPGPRAGLLLSLWFILGRIPCSVPALWLCEGRVVKLRSKERPRSQIYFWKFLMRTWGKWQDYWSGLDLLGVW